jgi:hypothetical protein
MGHGLGDFSAYEKHAFGWIDSVARPVADGTYAVSAIDRASPGPHALHVLVAGDEYWFEYRSPAPRWDPHQPGAVPGLVVYGGPHLLDATPSRFPVRNLLIRNPVGKGRPAIRVGERFRVPGAFEVTLASMGADGAETSFRWLDRTPPTAVQILQPAASSKVGSNPLVRWRAPRERGSGVSGYEILVDGRLTRTLPAVRPLDTALIAAPLYLWLGRLATGQHTVAIVAVDRAGNRSLPMHRRFVVRG